MIENAAVIQTVLVENTGAQERNDIMGGTMVERRIDFSDLRDLHEKNA
jgi:hypothetical protein